MTLPAISLLVSGLLAGAAPAAVAGSAAASVPETPDHLWNSTCGYCHGGPIKAPELRGVKLPEDVVIATVRHGAAGMPPFHASSIADADLRALARWIAVQPAPRP